ncbi:DNA translocase FtsK [Bacillus sp. ISL-51]|uniref:DNA translocase FtsK n=1 Tax=unclassified Bacillus (in: firmicutes) TaxID=185979 RepID=UPI001BE8A936|nr:MULTISPECIES: DNA translocase FtsK [unclassified Bacillus (in: firmicutes)]MBT2574058.1 DNA translocase FtsK [Bacillus sp. ISL-51]MBT2636010.1 DNA translocase FtsK [Bacillus sp. ISL-26]
MSWLNKFFDLFLGEKEEHEREADTHVQVQKQQTPDQPEGKITRMEDPKIYYEYPKGNFRFPVVPDGYKRTEQRQTERQERRRAPSGGYTARKEQTEQKEHTYKEPEAVKKPFKPTSIPSPVHGFQSQHSKKKAAKPVKQNEESVTLLSEEIKKEQAVPPKARPEPEKEPGFAQHGITEHDEQEAEKIPAAPKEQVYEESEPQLAYSKESQLEEQQEEYIQHGPETSLPAENAEEPVREESELHSVYSCEAEPAEEEQQEEYIQQEPEAALPAGIAEDSVHEEPEPQPAYRKEAQPYERKQPQTDRHENEEILAVENRKESEPQPAYSETAQPAEETEELPAAQSDDNAGNTEQSESPHMHMKRALPKAPEKQEQPKERSVPFNVMMLKSDKHKQSKLPEGGTSYIFPNVSLLDVPPAQKQDDQSWIEEQRELLNVTLKNFNVRAHVVHVTQGPSVTRFEVHPEPGVKVNKITNLADDIKLSLSAKDIRIEAPIPGKNTIGIEVPNRVSKVVDLRQMIRSAAFRTNPSPLTAALGVDISGNPVVIDLKKMPHGLIAGATGSGKSVCINTILVSLLYKADPSDVKVLLIDPKMVELAPYNQIPHLISPVITDAKAATAALKWVVEEMERRYELFAHSGVRDIGRFNELSADHKTGEKLPYLVVVIDELADLMMVAPNDVEESIARIAQKARACGIHLLVATQRPSVDVITGMIKANIPTRIAFSVSSQVDSRTIIDMAGAEKLLGKGDMLFWENGTGKPVRLQGNFVSDREIDRVVSHVRQQLPPSYLFEQEELIRQGTALKEEDELFPEACEFVVEQNSASTSSLQRRFRIGYNRAARLIDMMEAEGMISEAKGSKPREVLITAADISQE